MVKIKLKKNAKKVDIFLLDYIRKQKKSLRTSWTNNKEITYN